MKMKAKKFICVLLIAMVVLTILAGCGEKSGGAFVIELYPEYAPLTVENFVKLTDEGFFDGMTFHRIVDGFMAQGGGYDADGEKIEADSIFGEFAINGFSQNTLSHTNGVISMARMDTTAWGDPTIGYNSASSEFFIVYGDKNTFLDGMYAAFGKVVEGMEIVEKLQEVERTWGFDGDISSPVNPVIIKKATVTSRSGNPKIKMELEPLK